MTNKKISTRQFAILYAMASTAPIIMVIPTYIAGRAKNDSWISAILGALTGLAVILLMNYITKRRHESLCEICESILTKPVGKAVEAVYLVWCFLMMSLFIHYYSERIVSTLLPNCTTEFVNFFMFLLLALSLKNGISASGRMINFIFGVFSFIFIMLSLVNGVGRLDYNNLLPVFNADLKGILTSSVSCGSVFCIIFFMYFFYDDVTNDKGKLKNPLKGWIFLLIFSLLIILSTIGIVGYGAVMNMSFPYFEIIKNIPAFAKVNRFESLIYSIWVVSDFSVLFIFSYICISIEKRLFCLKDKLTFTFPTLLMGFALSELIYRDQFLLEQIAKNYLFTINLILCAALPIVLILVGKLRKKL